MPAHSSQSSASHSPPSVFFLQPLKATCFSVFRTGFRKKSDLLIPAHRRGAFAQSRVSARTRQAVASTQFTIVSSSFTSFRCFQQVHHIVFFTTFVSSPTATAQPGIVHIMFFSPVSSVLSSRPPLSRPVRIPVQSCTISRVTSVPISTIVEIIFASFQRLGSVSRFRETRQSLPAALHHFRHQRHGGQAQRNPSQHFSFPFVWFWGFHSLRVMVFPVFRTGFRKNPFF